MADALVLGAGIMGLSAAWGLLRAGHSVTVVEQDAVPNPRGSSVDEHRLIRHAYGAAAGYMRMVDDAYAAWDLLWQELGEVPYARTGVLALGDGGAGWLDESRATLRGAGHPVRDLGAADLATHFPMIRAADLDDAFHMAEGGVLLAGRIVTLLAAHLRQRGVGFIRGRATAVDPARAVLVLEDGRTLQAGRLVLAAGPWAPRLIPGLSARVTPSRQIVVYLEPPPQHRAAWAAAPMILDLSAAGGFYAVPPVQGTRLKIGDHRFSCHGDAEDPREALAAEAEAILELARPRLRDAESYRVLEARACYYDVEPEERFVVEPVGERCVVMSGFSGHGFKFGAVLGLAVGAWDLRALPGWAAGQGGAAPVGTIPAMSGPTLR
ncbi:FAD-dependent oxidoreductase [Teichococcus vastitatis]|uniref:FAD-dependent oxidoreductase n=1 Tax=Teichococcus vastitatis TaxID=2307076 RepID=A0ABS9WCK8_9PROT|nr:FAD-dependent oxidoreductase [Pseudoroseomonas vastitatis]MCI0756943.1 FAD-dependent oxidoreductase [Pseudoroseomonas vastitatis]